MQSDLIWRLSYPTKTSNPVVPLEVRTSYNIRPDDFDLRLHERHLNKPLNVDLTGHERLENFPDLARDWNVKAAAKAILNIIGELVDRVNQRYEK